MEPFESHSGTRSDQTAGRDNRRAADEMFPQIYAELHKLADSWLRKLPDRRILQPTVLVHEAYLRLAPRTGALWESRRHFFFAAARAMHDALVDDVRRQARRKRGGGFQRVEADEGIATSETSDENLLALGEALDRLEKKDARQHRIVLLRFFVGLTEKQTAARLHVSARTVQREWRNIRARLHKEIVPDDAHAAPRRTNNNPSRFLPTGP